MTNPLEVKNVSARAEVRADGAQEVVDQFTITFRGGHGVKVTLPAAFEKEALRAVMEGAMKSVVVNGQPAVYYVVGKLHSLIWEEK